MRGGLAGDGHPRDRRELLAALDLQRAASPRARAEANLAALRTLATLRESGAHPTATQLAALRGFSGWGGCADAFSFKPEWRDVAAQLAALLDEDEYAQARGSTLTAFYTPGQVAEAMWAALEKAGLPRDAAVLEPGCGTGNFIAARPDDARVRMTGVELDPISADIARLLNPDASIVEADLARCIIPDGSFDAAIGNVPYSADITVDYRTLDGRTVRMPLHDYCIERAVDALRPGGTAVLLTSRWTLDKRSTSMRADVARKAELAAMVRLPSSTFTRQAGTDAVTDVLVLRRRARTLDETPDEPWIETTQLAVPGHEGTTVTVNAMPAVDTGRHVAGDLVPIVGRFGGDLDVRLDGGDDQAAPRLASLLAAQLDALPPARLGDRTAEPSCIVKPDHVAAYSYEVDEHGAVWFGDERTVELAAAGDGEDAQRLRGMIRLRDSVRALQRLELDADADDASVAEQRRLLNEAYDGFAARFGHLCDTRNRRLYSNAETGWHLLHALERTDPKGRWLGKAEIFERRTLTPLPPTPEHCDTLGDAFNVSLDRNGRVDVDLIARLTDSTPQDTLARLEAEGLTVTDPDTGRPVPADDYLSGDVVAKARHVHALARDARHRVERGIEDEWARREQLAGPVTTMDAKADEWISTVGGAAWRSLIDPDGTGAYVDPDAMIDKQRDYTFDWGTRPGLVIALACKALETMPAGQRLTLVTDRPPTDPQDRWNQLPPAWHDARGTNRLWDALVWTPKRHGRYQPALANEWTTLRDAATFLLLLTRTDRADDEDKKAILKTLFESMPGPDREHRTVWRDTPIGAALRELTPDAADTDGIVDAALADPSLMEYVYSAVRAMPDLPRMTAGYRGRPVRIPVDMEALRDHRARRTEFMAQRREAEAERIAQDRAEAARLDALAERLDAVRPMKLETSQISAPLGAPWIPPRDVHDFMLETFHVRNAGLSDAKLAQYTVDYVPTLGTWRVGYSAGADIAYEAVKEYGTGQLNPFQLLEACLNNTQIRITKDSDTETTKDGKPRRVVDQQATMMAVEKADRLRDAWNRWVFEDPQRARRLTDRYSDRFNNIRPKRIDGSYLTTPGIADGMRLRPHQKDAVARALRSDEGTLIAHVVGAGKTFEGAAITHEARRLGKATKPMLVVPNHLVGQWADDVMRLYPTSRILAMGRDDTRDALSVRRFWGRVMTGDWDAVIVPESRFSQLHVSRERRVAGMQRRVDEYVRAIVEATAAHGGKDPTVKRLEGARKRVEAALERLRDGKESRDDEAMNGITFEQLGVDMLFVDEAHHFKNLGVPVASADLGMTVTSAAKCEDMLDKCEWLRESGHGGNVVFATGTPVSNSMSELFNMQRYLAPGTLRAQGLDTFAAWAGTFGTVVPTVELKPEGGGFQVKQRFARFQNLPELMGAIRSFADVITNDDIELALPECEMIPVAVPITDRQRAAMESLVERAERVRAGTVPPDQDNMLSITGDGRMIALDPKLLRGHADEPPLEGGKVDACARNVARIWRETEADRGAQLVFCDTSTPASGRWNIYEDLKRRLIDAGVPSERIAFVHDAGDNPDRREALFAKVRDGEIRVLLGSTQKLGTGTNVQTRLAAIHDLDCPWRPADLEQRLGRIVRQGNLYGKVRDFRYITEGTFDAYAYQTVERKQRFIGQVMSSKSPAREASDLDDVVVDYATLKAVATGDPAVQRRMNLENEISQLTILRRAWASEQADTRRDVETWLRPAVDTLRRRVREHEEDEASLTAAAALHRDRMQSGTWEGIAVDGIRCTDRHEACLRIAHAAATMPAGVIGEYDGLSIVSRLGRDGHPYLGVRAAHDHWTDSPIPSGDAVGTGSIVSQLDRLIKHAAAEGPELDHRLEEAESRLATAEESLTRTWPRAGELTVLQTELDEIIREAERTPDREPVKDDHEPATDRQSLIEPGMERLEHVVFQTPDGDPVDGWWSDVRLDDANIPDGYRRYSIRGSDDDTWTPANIERRVLVNHTADILTTTDLDRRIDGNDGWIGIEDWYFDDGEPLVLPDSIVLRRGRDRNPDRTEPTHDEAANRRRRTGPNL